MLIEAAQRLSITIIAKFRRDYFSGSGIRRSLINLGAQYRLGSISPNTSKVLLFASSLELIFLLVGVPSAAVKTPEDQASVKMGMSRKAYQ